MKWDESNVWKAANDAATLSDLLEQDEGLKFSDLKWVKRDQIEKFSAAFDAKEADRVKNILLRDWSVLDWLWVIGPESDSRRQYTDVRDEAGAGRKLVSRFAEFEPQLVNRWWRQRWKNGHGIHLKLTRLQNIALSAISEPDFKRALPTMSDVAVAAVLSRRPDFVDLMPTDRFLSLITLDVNKETAIPKLIRTLSEQGIPSDSNKIIDDILALPIGEITSELNELVSQWHSVPGRDPVAVSIVKDERLREIFRSYWHSASDLSKSKDANDIWRHPLQWSVREALASAVSNAPNYFKRELGFSVGVRIAEKEDVPSRQLIRQHLESIGVEVDESMVTAILPTVELWAALRTLAKYEDKRWQHETEVLGLRTTITALAEGRASLWADSLTWILIRGSKFGDFANALTLELATNFPAVRSALEEASRDDSEEVRLKAQGLLTLLHGLDEPTSGLARTLADAAAHYIDGSPIFPHPLTPVSATWLGSTGVEQAIANGVKRAARRFAEEVTDQGGNVEEALTQSLVKEIEVEFRSLKPQIKLLGSSRRSPAPILDVRQRPISKVSEEPIYGCDLALLVNGTVRGRYSSTWVELVQVKKTKVLHGRRKARYRADSWGIETKQLGDILKWSPTASYWLIASNGEVLVVPAKHLLALRDGKGKTHAEKFTVGYHEVRSVGIPLEQYLVDLLIGQWVGTTASEVLSLAQGENTNIRPRIVIEITIAVNQENQ